MRGIDQRLDLVIEHLSPEPGADAAVDAAGAGDLDDIDAAADLRAHRLAAAFGAVAEILAADCRMEIFGKAQAAVHVTCSGRDRNARVEDARPYQTPGGDLVAQRQRRAAPVAQIADGGETRHQRLGRIGIGAKGGRGVAAGDAFEQCGIAPCIAVEMDMGIDQSGQDIPG